MGRTQSGMIMFTWCTQQVSEFLESAAGPQSKSKIAAGIKRNERLTTTAIGQLIQEGFASSEQGAHLISLVKPYCQDAPLVENGSKNPFYNLQSHSMLSRYRSWTRVRFGLHMKLQT